MVDENLEILPFRGESAPYLEQAADEPTLRLIEMGRGAIDSELRKLAAKAANKAGTVQSGTVPLACEGAVHHVRFSMTPIVTPSGRRQYLVVVEEVQAAEDEAESPAKTKRAGGRRRIAQLEDELLAAKEHLRVVLEEHQGAIEELRSSNEEIQSGSEELQSTNEELLTAKEELQSTNEELNTVNEELRSRNWELNQSNSDLVNLLASVNIPILMVTNDLRIRRFTPQAEKLLNLLSTDVGRPISDLRPKIEVPRLEDRLREAIDNLSLLDLDVRDSEGKTYSMSIRPYRTMDNRIDGAVMALFDVTERKRAAEARYTRLFEAATDGILIADAINGATIDVNPFLLGLLGCTREELVGRPFWEADPFRGTELDEQWLRDLGSRNLDKQGTIQTELRVRPASEPAVAVEVTGNGYVEGDRKLIRINVTDVTRRKQLEERLRRSEEHIRQAEKMEAIGQLTSGLAHDFNNLMTAIIAQCQLVQMDRESSDPVVSEVEAVIAVASRAAKLTQQLLAFGRKQMLQPRLLRLNRVLKDMKPMIDAVVKENVQFHIKPDGEIGTIRADRGQIEQVILNLVLNSRDAMPAGGRITAETTNVDVEDSFSMSHSSVLPGRFVRLTLTDTGIGMSAEVQSHLFEPFFTTKPRGIGTGLGLSTAYGIVQQSGGSIHVDSEPGRGTAVSIYFPRIDEQADEECPEPSLMIPGGRRGSVMLVEDEGSVRVPVAEVLRKAGYTVLDAESGPMALQMAELEDGPIDLLVTDVVMPGMSGKELADRLAIRRPGLKVLFVSGQTENAIVDQGIVQEGVELLPKPFTTQALLAKVDEVLRAGE
jgi:two-component system, cell cycle sensor histidine kinase and response regulator CckA